MLSAFQVFCHKFQIIEEYITTVFLKVHILSPLAREKKALPLPLFMQRSVKSLEYLEKVKFNILC